jgi:hypothetical protein
MTSVLKTALKTGLKTAGKYGKYADEVVASAGISAGTGGDAPTVIKDVVQGIAQEVSKEVAIKVATKSATSFGGKMAASATAGPIGWAVAIIQLTFAVLDILWNPFKSYYNKDLAELKDTIDVSIRKQFLENGSDYPLEIKPNIIPSTDEEIDEYYRLKKEYYENNGLISSEEVFKEENLYNEIGLLKRNMRIALNPLYDNINLYSGTTQNIALLIATAAAKKRGYGKKFSKAIDLKNYKPSTPYKKYVTWLKFNWQLLVSISVILILIICSSMLLFFV